DGMQAAGVKLAKHIRDTNFMGFTQVLRNLRTIFKIMREIKEDILAFQPDAVVLIDYPGFNLRIAKFLREKGIKVFYYISPKVWAWKKSRVKKIRRDVDRLFAILPFEKEFFAKEGMEIDFVGHPLLDEIQDGTYQGDALRAQFLKPNQRLVALLPGSRKQEISRMLPRMMEVLPHFPNCKFVIAGAPTQSLAFYASLIGNRDIPVVTDQTYDLLDAADAALVTSGTATLETALFGVPEVVCYAGSAISVQLARWLIQVKYISLVNLILDREAVKELIQQDLNTEQLSAELRALLDDPDRRTKMLADYTDLRNRLGDTGASSRTASLILQAIR
ncbi:MAG TPA: lipid-A-disaccharide synthase, partial [Bacteroidetes bacterium]|nr:lipid-A-disaccharide synthase [Bacteroidota bacterium]